MKKIVCSIFIFLLFFSMLTVSYAFDDVSDDTPKFVTIQRFNKCLENCYMTTKFGRKYMCMEDENCSECMDQCCDKYNLKPSKGKDYYILDKELEEIEPEIEINNDNCFINNLEEK